MQYNEYCHGNCDLSQLQSKETLQTNDPTHVTTEWENLKAVSLAFAHTQRI